LLVIWNLLLVLGYLGYNNWWEFGNL
jgi:hypothetical protein